MDETTVVTLVGMVCCTVVMVSLIRALFIPAKDGKSQFVEWGERIQQQNKDSLTAELEKERMLRGVYVIQSSNGVHIVPAAGQETERPQLSGAAPPKPQVPPGRIIRDGDDKPRNREEPHSD